MKATFDEGLITKTEPIKATFGWYLVESKSEGGLFIALVTPYGVTYIDKIDGKASYSDRDFFNRKYAVLEYFPDATFHVKLKG